MDSFQYLSLDDISPRRRLQRSMSDSEISPRKEILIAEKLISGPTGNKILRQYSYHELGVISGTSLRYSQKFVSELQVDLTGSSSSPEVFSTESNKEENMSKLNKELKSVNYNSNKIKDVTKREGWKHRKRSHMALDSKKDFKRIKFSPSQDTKGNSLRNTSNDNENLQSRTTTQLLYVIIPFIIAVLATCGTHYAICQKMCNASLNVSSSEYVMKSSIFGQERAVKSIIDTLKTFTSTEQGNGLQLMVFTGATGVGKTFTASLLEKLFPWKQNIYNFIMPIDFETLSQHLLQKYPYCGDHLVIIDDMRVEDIGYISVIVSHLKNLAEKNKVLAVLIFKFHNQLSGENLENELQKSEELQRNLIESNVNSVTIDFKTLEKRDVIECIKDALSRYWIPVSEEAISSVLDQVDYHSEGCKRISSKVAVVNKLWIRES